ncbi:MAG: hypothetical protein A2W99_09430 [Bacteroidetes bacterium GWF2_33_16]|nr:MAG: hypothetical protein A2X00_06340 [Bacteroidetes bacterium GWE2_32_14]OFY07218.1 MAG: hypothetical protein A2W99_09430 [Bacteroidetes bacterium GWF2_33_16]
MILICFISSILTSDLKAQNVTITDDESYTANTSAMLDVKSTTKGLLVPRLTTTQRNSIVSPAQGLMVFDTDLMKFMYYNGTVWTSIPQLITDTGAGEALFAVVNASGDTVFAVYPDGVKVFVDPDAKGKVGGFAVSGRTPTKEGGNVEYFRVTPDSTRIYVNDSIGAKGKVGGFAVSGRTPTKEYGIKDYFIVNRDSTRIYIDSTASKGKVGGFAVSGRTPTKAGFIPDDYFNISSGSSADKITSDARIAWYPKKEAFLAGRVQVLAPDSVGLNSFVTGYHSMAKGNYSQAFGYEAKARGNYSTAIGYLAIANNDNSFAFGQNAKALASYSFALGDQVTANNSYSYSFGRLSIASGDFAVAIGNAAIASGLQSFSVNGTASGDYSKSFGGEASGNYSLTSGYDVTASGLNSTAIGYRVKATNKNAFAVGTGGNSTLPPYLPTYTTASGENSIAFGTEASASGLKSIAFGEHASALNENSVAIGMGAYAIGKSSICIGNYTFAYSAWSTVLGYDNIESGDMYNIIMTDPLFVIGNGFSGTPSNALTILKNGKMGILNPSPTYYLDVSGTARTTSSTYLATTSGNVGIGATSTTYKLDVTGTARSTAGAYFATLSGNVGIGTTSTSYKLDVAGTANFNKNLTGVALRTNGTETLWFDGTYFSWGYGGTYNYFARAITIADATNRSSTYKLYVAGNAYATGSWSSSDLRYKKNVSPLNNILSDLLKISAVRYEWNQNEFKNMNFDDKTHIGVIAQDVEKIFPELVITDDNGYKAVAYDKLSAILLEGTKEQQIQIEQLKKENTELKKRLDQLEGLKTEIETIKAVIREK